METLPDFIQKVEPPYSGLGAADPLSVAHAAVSRLKHLGLPTYIPFEQESAGPDINPAPEVINIDDRRQTTQTEAVVEDSPDDEPESEAESETEAVPEAGSWDDPDLIELEAKVETSQKLLDGVVVGTAEKDYLQRLFKHRILKAPEELELAKRIERGDLVAKDTLVVNNMRLVGSIARKYVGLKPSLSFADLVQEGVPGVIRAAEKFDYRKGYKFSTFATWWIRQSITRALQDRGDMIRKPVHVGETAYNIVKARRLLEQEHAGQEPTLEMLSKATGVPIDRIVEIEQAFVTPDSLDRTFRSDEPDSMTLGDSLVRDEPSVPALAIDTERKEEFEAALNMLEPREAAMLRMYNGVGGNKPATLQVVGDQYGLTRERVRQILEESTLKLIEIVASGAHLKKTERRPPRLLAAEIQVPKPSEFEVSNLPGAWTEAHDKWFTQIFEAGWQVDLPPEFNRALDTLEQESASEPDA